MDSYIYSVVQIQIVLPYRHPDKIPSHFFLFFQESQKNLKNDLGDISPIENDNESQMRFCTTNSQQ